ncbi:NAD(P)/FAD-dependent oxidoreductase [Xylophilus sp. Leaf220]|uniref:NAD(P)/FAD-dependent oxidoreductase n=1 Tax=Xylophilus sp. Leaf220 TaxID=1735686 RepID=UPI000A675BA3|nr:NAD(P)/FAD-dependent oxidoreductase [Xylophilus sp. Leaf220]
MAAALPLARARRRILVVDGGQRRNRFADHSHGFLTRDGTPAAEVAAIGRAQLMPYGTVEWLEGEAGAATQADGAFHVEIGGRVTRSARRLVLATGVVDTLPPVPGLHERWGRHVFHCPYCHGYELDQGRIGVLGTSALSLHQALLLPDWGPTALFLDETMTLDAAQQAQLQARGVAVETTPVERIVGRADVVLRDGRIVALAGLFTVTETALAGQAAASLGCGFTDGPMGPVITTDAMKATTVPGVFACGDAARAGGSVALAVSDGTVAGVAAHQSLVFGLRAA